jgi:hypothetical protein
VSEETRATVDAPTLADLVRPAPNGVGTLPERRLPVFVKRIEVQLEGFEGWWAVVRTNPRQSTIEKLADGNTVYEAFLELVQEWNFVDEAGQPIPLTPEGVKIVPNDLMLEVIARWAEVRRLPPQSAGRS